MRSCDPVRSTAARSTAARSPAAPGAGNTPGLDRHRAGPDAANDPKKQGRGSWWKRFAAAAATAVLGLGLTAGAAGTATAASSTAAASGVSVLMQSYSSSTGLIGADGWWTSAVALSTVMTYQQATGDTSYEYAISAAFNDNKSSNFEDAYMDDTGWWALAWVQAYDITGDAAYLQMAETDADYIHGYWDSTCNGGVYWSTAKNYKNAIANELFLALTAALHNRIPGDTTYLGWADAEWSWFSGSGMINSSDLINDGLTSTCQNNGETTWTYNQGVVLAGLSELHRATGNTALLGTAESIANAATARLTTNGVLVEPCEPSCGSDGPSFKGVFVRGLRTLATAAGTTAYDAFLQTQATSIEAHDTTSSGQLGLSWAGPIQGLTSGAQASATDALVAAVAGGGTTPPPVTGVPITSGVAGKCLDDSGGSSTDGTKADLWDCNGTAAQQWQFGNSTLKINGKCLDVTGGSTADGALVEIWDCNGGANQVWNSVNNTLVNPASGKCLDDPGLNTTDGTQLDIWDCNGGANQKWTMSPVLGPVVSGVGGLCLDDSTDSTADGNKIDIWGCNSSSAQQWELSNNTLVNNGKCLDVAAGGTADGTLVQLYTCNGTGAQTWQAQADGELLNPQSGKCLDDPAFSSTAGTQLDIWDCNDGGNQQWTLPSA
jgi:predicted alpha-1,6-mannanase (GH76 family)